mgnify:CR=1 FL=1
MINESSKKNLKNKIKQQTNNISLKENDMESNSEVVSNEEQDDDFYNKDDFINEIDFDEKEAAILEHVFEESKKWRKE